MADRHGIVQQPRWRALLLRADALFLIVSGSFGLAADLASYFAGAGPFGTVFLGDQRVIGVVEAHGLAVLTGIAAWAAARLPGAYWHWHLAATHALLGGANIAFFGVFDAVGARTGGIAVTAVHFAFVLAQGWATLSRRLRHGTIVP